MGIGSCRDNLHLRPPRGDDEVGLHAAVSVGGVMHVDYIDIILFLCSG